MKWVEFKMDVEAKGIKDTTEIMCIDWPRCEEGEKADRHLPVVKIFEENGVETAIVE
jgi:hypothetical protein